MIFDHFHVSCHSFTNESIQFIGISSATKHEIRCETSLSIVDDRELETADITVKYSSQLYHQPPTSPCPAILFEMFA
jgi:hypothetical protein